MSRNSEKRNAFPGEVFVKGWADVQGLKTLSERVEAIVENRNETFIHNMEHILHRQRISQYHMCNVDLEGSPSSPQMAVYKQIGKDIPFRTIVRIAAAYGYTPEQLTGQLLDQTEADSERSEYAAGYVGTYHIAYLASDASVSYGMVSVYPETGENGAPALEAVGIMGILPEERTNLLRFLKAAEPGGRGIRNCYERIAFTDPESRKGPRAGHFYEGKLERTAAMAEITLRQKKSGDVIHIRLDEGEWISEENVYRGGAAAMLSTSQSRVRMPCVQAAALSRRSLEGISEEMLSEMLHPKFTGVDLRREAREIAAYMQGLFPGTDAESPMSRLSEVDRMYTLECFIEKKLAEVLQHRMPGCCKISEEMAPELYHLLCE